ncbi:MAG: two-component system sensor histidine kinase/response regulator, partial [Planctomycetaceae bacterium]
MLDHPGNPGTASSSLPPVILPRRSHQVRRMSDSLLSSFVVTKPADVIVAARKARILASLANLEKTRRTRLSKAVTETCRGVLSFGGVARVTFGIADSNGQASVEITVVWQATDDTKSVSKRSAETLDSSLPDGSEAGHPEPLVSQKNTDDTPAMAMRRLGELLDDFRLDGWPQPGAVAVLRMNAPPEFEFTDADLADWSAFLEASQLEESLRRAEQRRKLLASELRASQAHVDLIKEAGSETGETRLVRMLSLVASQTDNGVVILDQDACVAWVNRAFTAQWGYQFDDSCGMPFADLILHEESAASSDRLRTVLETGGSDYVELLVRQADGTGRWTGVTLSPSLDDSEKVQRWILLLRDVTQQKSANDTLAAARDAAEQANRLKSEFLANMSHEIRTPMNAVIGMTELALGTELTPEQHEYLSTVRMSAEALLELLNDILDLSKIEAGKVELDEVDFDLAEVVRDALKSLAVKAHNKGLELATRMPMDLPNHLHGDPLRLRQVIINLVGNAIKFTDHGEVVVEFERSITDQTAGKVDLRFTVRDTGIGIPPDGIARIFESFTQLDASTTRQYGGTGLGLTITSELLRLMGGHIHVESEMGVGSEFQVSLPFCIVDGPAQSFAERLNLSRKQLEGRTVLVVDDNATNRRILEEFLTSWGLRPRIVSGADDALKELEAASYYGRPFDLLLVDAMMPGTDGFELVSEIRRRKDWNAGTVMMLSSADRADSARRCRELSISSYLVKPVSQSSLLESILNILSTGSSMEGGATQTGQSRTQLVQTANFLEMQPPQEKLAIVPLRILVADDHEANRLLAQKLLEKRG